MWSYRDTHVHISKVLNTGQTTYFAISFPPHISMQNCIIFSLDFPILLGLSSQCSNIHPNRLSLGISGRTFPGSWGGFSWRFFWNLLFPNPIFPTNPLVNFLTLSPLAGTRDASPKSLSDVDFLSLQNAASLFSHVENHSAGLSTGFKFSYLFLRVRRQTGS